MVLTEETYLTVEETARILRLHPETVKILLRDGKIPGRKVGRKWRVSQIDLDTYMREKKGEGK
jgi:excisionase family DNA binding protein